MTIFIFDQFTFNHTSVFTFVLKKHCKRIELLNKMLKISNYKVFHLMPVKSFIFET